MWRWIVLSLPGCGREVVLGAQQGDLGLEVMKRLETPVDRCKPEVGHLVQRTQWRQHRKAHLIRWNLGAPACSNGLFDVLGQPGQFILADRAALTCLPDTGQHLRATEGLCRATALNDGEARGLHRRESPTTGGTRAAAPNRTSVISRPAIDDTAVAMSTERTVHDGTSLQA
jgi:hypothetical protein